MWIHMTAFPLIQLSCIYNFNINALSKLTSVRPEINPTHVFYTECSTCSFKTLAKSITKTTFIMKGLKQKDMFRFHFFSFTFGNKRSLNTSKLQSRQTSRLVAKRRVTLSLRPRQWCRRFHSSPTCSYPAPGLRGPRRSPQITKGLEEQPGTSQDAELSQFNFCLHLQPV